MQRRDFLNIGAVIGGGMLLSACGSDDTAPVAAPQTNPQFSPGDALTYYAEIRVAPPANGAVLTSIDSLMETMKTKTGYLSYSLKQMTGESTMVKNYPDSVKGVLDRGYANENGTPTLTDGAAKVPYFYSLFVRFDNHDNLIASDVQRLFQKNIVPKLFAYTVMDGKPMRTSIALQYHEGIYVTVAAGDSTRIYETEEDIKTFLRTQSDEVKNKYVTVENHVMIKDENLIDFNLKVRALLEVAQTTYQPNDGSGNGISGKLELNDTNYRKAVTTEILQNIYADGDLRAYLMHGVWESVADHENSHTDRRFQQAAGQVGAYVVVGPVEPFYDTLKQHNNVV